jgi:hypothetical protein
VAQDAHQVFDFVEQLDDALHGRAQRRWAPLAPGSSSASAAKAPRTLSAQDL